MAGSCEHGNEHSGSIIGEGGVTISLSRRILLHGVSYLARGLTF
jgi:hypothetical protein